MSALMKSIAFVLLVSLLSTSAHAQVFNRSAVFEGTPARAFDDREQVVGDQLFYVDRQRVLHVTDGTSEGSLALLDNIAFTTSEPGVMAALGDTLYVVRGSRVGSFGQLLDFELWQTDGTLANTQRSLNIDLPAPEFIQGLRAIGNRLFVVGASDNDNFSLVVTDGTQSGTFTLPVSNPQLETLCLLSETNFYLFAAPIDAVFPDGTVLMHFDAGQLEAVNLDDPGLELRARSIPEQVGDQCIYRTVEQPDLEVEQLVSLDADGTQINYTLPLNITPPSTSSPDTRVATTSFQDTLLVSRARGASNAIQITRFGDLLQLLPGNPELSPVVLAGDTEPLNAFTIDDIQTGSENVYIRFRSIQTDPPTIPVLTAYNGDFDPVASDQSIREYEIISLNGEDFLFDPEDQRIDRLDGGISNVLRPYDMNINRIISDPNSNNAGIYAIASDLQTSLDAVYRLNSQPMVSERLQGIWGNNAFNRTGVQINTAIGSDGQTRFLFVALLAHDLGMPLWIAGASPIVDGNTQITFDLRLTEDLEFLVPDETLEGQRTEVGSVVLTVLGCNQIRLEFNLIDAFGDHDLVFGRVIDTTYAPLCNNDS